MSQRFTVAFVLAALGCGAVVAATQANKTSQYRASFGQIIERCGTAGALTVGQSAAAQIRQYRSTGQNEFTSPDGTVVTVTPPNSTVTEIRVGSPGVFTQRYVVIRETRLSDVLQLYGQPQPRQNRARRTERDLVVEYAYEGISFVFAGVPANTPVNARGSVSAENNRPITAAIVHAKDRDPSGRDHSCVTRK